MSELSETTPGPAAEAGSHGSAAADRELERKNLIFGLLLFGVFLFLLCATVVVAFIYLALA
ncbi:MAG TPA: hypothetical protein VLU96_01700 [Gaiellaceae bacterium]|nr:hypothetical protein [Gaiellaceae bacterium]